MTNSVRHPHLRNRQSRSATFPQPLRLETPAPSKPQRGTIPLVFLAVYLGYMVVIGLILSPSAPAWVKAFLQ